MPELEAHILQWKQTLFTVFGGHLEIIEELESHLRDEIDRLTHAGQTPEAALAAAQANLGRPVELAAEYSRAVGRAGWPVVGCWLGLLGLVCALLSGIIIRQVGWARGDGLLAVHVAAIVLGYVVAFAAAFLATVYVVRWLVCPVSLGERRLVGQVLFLANGVSAGFLLLGIALGMVWARQQWGISWSNDPREIATVLAVLWFAAITGLWWLLPHKQHLWMLLSIVGGGVGVWGWFGPHLFPVGLHAYGFVWWVPSLLFICTAVSLAVALLGMLPPGLLKRRAV